MLRIESIYIEHLQDWFTEFGTERAFIFKMEAFDAHPKQVFLHILEFLQLPSDSYPWNTVPRSLRKEHVSEGSAARQLRKVFNIYTRYLTTMLHSSTFGFSVQ
jgi:hypothetical protein